MFGCACLKYSKKPRTTGFSRATVVAMLCASLRFVRSRTWGDSANLGPSSGAPEERARSRVKARPWRRRSADRAVAAPRLRPRV